MKQVTGSNIPDYMQRVSVRIDSGGHSFSPDSLPQSAFEQGVLVMLTVVSHKSVLVPLEVFEPADAATYLAVAGLGCSADEEPMHIANDGKVAVTAVKKGVVQAVRERIGERAVLVSPLLTAYDDIGRKLHIRTLGSVSYFHFKDGGELLFAEALKTADSDEVLYYTSLLDRNFGLDGCHIYIYGDRAAESAKLLKRYFDNVRCE